MCGIAGLIGKKITEKTILNLETGLKHRGPNNFGKYINLENTPVQLFHFRLSIIDLSNLANQPFKSDCGRYTLIFNGEIYNYESLRLDLSSCGYNFKTNSDTEVLLFSFIKWGVDCLKRIEGMFAFAIWDNQDESLFIARDRFGEKPLYYFSENGEFGFSSEIRSLNILRTNSPKLNKEVLSTFLKYQTIPFENTLIKNINSLNPGHYLIIKNDKLDIKSYWNLKDSFFDNEYSNNLTSSDFKNILIKSVESALISDVPLGLFLSGGIDSSILTVIAKKYLKKNVSTFTVCFDNKYFKDKDYAAYVAKKYSTKHNEIYFNNKLIEENVFSALNDIDHPTADGINTWIVSKAVKDAGITVALSGIGSDEIFGGYNTFQRMNRFSKYNKYAPKCLSYFNNNKYIKFLTSDSLSEAYCQNRTFFSNSWLNKLLPNQSNPIDPYLANGYRIESGKSFNTFNFTSYMEISCYMSNVLLKDADQMSMAHSLEIRSPFLNHKVFESFQQLNNNDKFNYNIPKGILHKLFSEDFSTNFWNRPKQGFIMPWRSWLSNEIKPLSENIFKKAMEQQIFHKSGLLELKKSFETNQITWSRYWLLLSLTNWIDKNNIS